MFGISNTYYEIWINDVRIMVQPDLEARGSIFDVSIAHFKTANGHSFQPDGARSNPLFVRKHFLENGRWQFTQELNRNDKVAVATLVNKAHAFIHKLILLNGKPSDLPVNANTDSGTAWDVR